MLLFLSKYGFMSNKCCSKCILASGLSMLTDHKKAKMMLPVL